MTYPNPGTSWADKSFSQIVNDINAALYPEYFDKSAIGEIVVDLATIQHMFGKDNVRQLYNGFLIYYDGKWRFTK